MKGIHDTNNEINELNQAQLLEKQIFNNFFVNFAININLINYI
jgi:hypothetical protein